MNIQYRDFPGHIKWLAGWTLPGILLIANFARAEEPPAAATAIASNLFAVDLYSQVSRISGNVCVSPYSVSSALSMTANGAVGNTAVQMLSVLHWTGKPSDLPAAAAALTTSIDSTSKHQGQITIANALFGQSGFPYRKDFLDVLDHQYGAGMQEVDFAAQPAMACEAINHWAAEKTHDRIKQAITPSAINAQTRLILVNAIYFKDNWQTAFSKSATTDLPFSQDDKISTDIPTMHLKHSFSFMENDSVQVAELPYTGDFSMVVVLPHQRDGLAAAEKSLTFDVLNGWLDKLSPQLLQVYLPRFRTEGEYELKGDLQKLGMTDAFDPGKADFSGIVSGGGLKIDHVIHKTFISVDEAGTEAAAVTSVIARSMAARPRTDLPQPIVFRVNHPFLFILRHRSTGAILFMGRITQPK